MSHSAPPYPCGRMRPIELSRRQLLRDAACGFGSVALAALAPRYSPAAEATHHRPRAKQVIFLYMDGGPGQMDTFDPKPLLEKEHRKPFAMKKEPTQFDNNGTTLASPWKFKQYGQSGLPISDLFPHLATQADRLCVVRSMTSAFSEHTSANYFLHTGLGLAGRPSMGAWITYGLGSECENLPGYVVINGGLTPPGGLETFASGFLPADFQASVFGSGKYPVANLQPPNASASGASASGASARSNAAGGGPAGVRRQLLAELDRASAEQLGSPGSIEAAIRNYEMAFAMQTAVPELVDFKDESPETLAAYGIDHAFKPTAIYGRQCLLARRLIERGVRFVELTCPVTEGNDRWDQHRRLKKGHEDNARAVDQPIAALLEDLARRGMLDETLVVFAGEFGRTPFAQGVDGRDHNPFGFSIWMAGGGVAAGTAYGATDEYGYKAVENPLQMHDLHAMMLHLLGIDHRRLTFRFGGRDMRLTDVHGRIVPELLG